MSARARAAPPPDRTDVAARMVIRGGKAPAIEEYVHRAILV